MSKTNLAPPFRAFRSQWRTRALATCVAGAIGCALSCGELSGTDEVGAATGGSSADAGGSPSTGGQSAAGGSGGAAAGGQPGSGGHGETGDGGALGGSGSELAEVLPGEPPSCAGFEGTECQGGDCCASLLVPGGVALVDGTTQTLPSFYLDKYEVTVARFRQYMAALEEWAAAGNPVEGAGAHPLVPASGWQSEWLEITGDEGEQDVAHLELYEFFTDPESAAGITGDVPTYPLSGADQLALNYATFHAAFAFCIWDGGRLPAAAEWLYAAHGGDAHTAFPWGDAPDVAEVITAIPTPSMPEPFPDAHSWEYVGIAVGSHPAAKGRFGHEDLIGGFIEFVRDTWKGELIDEELIELAEDEPVHPIVEFSDHQNRMAVGVDWSLVPYAQTFIWDSTRFADDRPSGSNGFRCARDP